MAKPNYPRGGDKMRAARLPKPKAKPKVVKAKKARPVPLPKGRAIVVNQPTDPISALNQYTQSAITGDQSRTQQQAQWAADVYKALAGGLSNVGPQIQGIYRTAAADQSSFAKGYSDALQHLQQAGAEGVNKTIQTAGGDSSQMLHPTQAASDVLYGLGGAIPANNLTAQGAAFGSAASFLPASAAAQGQQLVAKMLQAAQERQAQFELERQKQMPGLIADQQAAKAKAALDAQNFKLKLSSLKLQEWKAILADKQASKRLYLEAKRLGLTERSQSFNEWYKQQTLNQAQQRIGISQQNASRGGASGKSGSGAYVIYQNGVPVLFNPKTGKVSPLNSVARGQQAVSDPLTGTPLSKAQIIKAGKDVIDTIRAGRARGWKLERILPHIREVIPEAIWAPIVYKQYNIPRSGKDLKFMNVNRLHAIAVVLGWDPSTAPKRGASKSELISWIQAHSGGGGGPKGNAAQGAAVGSSVVGVVESALQEQGVPYRWGGTTPAGFDCSGLLYWAFAQHGIKIPRTSQTQWRYGRKVRSVAEALPGDAFFYRPEGGGPGHVAMYIGNGKVVVAPHTGSYVQVVDWNSIGQFMGIRRLH